MKNDNETEHIYYAMQILLRKSTDVTADNRICTTSSLVITADNDISLYESTVVTADNSTCLY